MPGIADSPDDTSTSILVVDDDAEMVSLIESVLKRFGYSSASAPSAEGALERLAQSSFDLLVSDVNLGSGASGLDLIRRAMVDQPDMAVLMVSGLDDPATADEALRLGAFGYIIKPFAINELRIAVSNALRRRHLEIARRSHLDQLETAVEERTARLRELSEDLSTRERRFRSLTQATPLGVLYARTDGSCDYANRRAEILLGRSSHDLDNYRWLAGAEPADREALQLSIRSALSGIPEAQHEHRYLRSDGSTTWLHTRVAAVSDDAGATTGVLVLFEEIESRKKLDMRLRHQAMHDHLTGLPNRRHLKESLSELLSATDDGCVGLFMIDLDQFKLVNDTYGHDAGDDLIITTARRLTDWAGPDQIVARLGGDEFVVVTPLETPPAVAQWAESLHAAISGPTRLDSVELHLTASMGVATEADAGSSAADLMRAADVALYHAKERRNAVAFFDSEMAKGISRRLAVGSELKRAINSGAITVHYQPIVRAAGAALEGIEALARWTHPEWGAVGPDEFIPIAESAGLVHLIDQMVLAEAVSALAEWRQIGRVAAECFVSVNLSGRQLTNGALPADIGRALGEAGLPGRCLCVEVTETAVVTDLDRAIPVLHELRQMDVRTAIDDFGTGYSSLAVIRRLPLDFLKIDRAFVADISANGQDSGVIDTIIDIAHRCDLAVIAEGVEDRHQLKQLRAFGCDLVQGYLIGRPKGAETPPGDGPERVSPSGPPPQESARVSPLIARETQ